MSLVVDLSFVVRGMLDGRERIEVRRLEPLIDPTDPADETHPYAVTVYRSGIPVEQAKIEHRYGDGARVLATKALGALT